MWGSCFWSRGEPATIRQIGADNRRRSHELYIETFQNGPGSRLMNHQNLPRILLNQHRPLSEVVTLHLETQDHEKLVKDCWIKRMIRNENLCFVYGLFIYICPKPNAGKSSIYGASGSRFFHIFPAQTWLSQSKKLPWLPMEVA